MLTPSVTIIVLTWNQSDLTIDCLRSLVASDYPAGWLRIVAVDNASEDDTVSRIRREFPTVEVLVNATNLGFAEGNNVGITHAMTAAPDYLMLLNNDTLVAPDMVSRLVAVAERDPQIGIITPAVFYMDNPDVLWCTGATIDWARGTTKRINRDLLPESLGPEPFPVDIDVLLPGALRRLVDYLDTHPDDGAVYSDCHFCDTALNVTGRMSDFRDTNPTGDILPYLLLNARVCGTLFRVAAIRRHDLRYDPSILVSSDWDFIIQFAAHERFGHVAEASYLYRFHGNNITLSTWERRQESLILNRRKAMNSWFFDGLPDEVRARFLTDFLVFHLRGREAEQAELLAGPQVAALSPAGRAALYQSYGLSALECGDNAAARKRLQTSLAARPRPAARVLLLASYLPSAIVRPVLWVARQATGRQWSHPMEQLIKT